MTPKKPLKTINLMNIGVLWKQQMFGDMVVGYMPNSDPWGTPGPPFLTIFVLYVNPKIPNIEKFEAYEVYKSREVSHLFFSSNFPSNGGRIMSGELTRTPHTQAYLWGFIQVSYVHV